MKSMDEQEAFWAGDFGSTYISRNKDDFLLSSNIAFFSKILAKTHDIKSVIEYGANIGLNLKAIKTLLPSLEYAAIEINRQAVQELKKNEWIDVYPQSIVDFIPKKKYSFVFAKTVLIHINPTSLDKVYDLLYQSTDQYLMIAEYYNPTPVTIDYRGHQNKLFKRDFCGELLDKFSDLRLIDYGFSYHRDTYFPQDDISWFLLEKAKSSNMLYSVI